MARREAKPAHREEPGRGGRKPGGLFLGLLLGLIIGLVAAAGLAWYFNLRTGEFKPVAQGREPPLPVPPDPRVEPARKPTMAPAASEPEAAAATATAKPREATPREATAPIQERKPTPAREPPPSRVPLTFYGILPGEKPAKAVEPPKSKELWWLQVAALKNASDADKLKARLALLGLEVSTQKVENAEQTLYRVRVGPYKRDEDAFADLDTLSAHNYEPRLFKEPVKGAVP
ncbi:MAG: hypothetical protein COW48_04375 [Hydrogenophilales bacterium CG17_big_fil_post_rev_8_21_14_2_50_63_12]|nr:MAG: hypothetical protein COW48_04375 [Hydrogenophilales bacterium CG17_big_fil_post_rev_8_21_14_2_50_63_12]PIX98422.1 MAG: hypothetical protein COZ24_00290 [Hydrogenophilales bacterium CG_4_10_14_3_um_filter_63_21]PJB04902.1 MAG: hypothetical protein CO126_04225 [Hydrogenophilales bacterium CG_4_9_14_3_um_filter_63_34]